MNRLISGIATVGILFTFDASAAGPRKEAQNPNPDALRWLESTTGTYGKPAGALGPVTLGPKITVGSLPVPLGVGIEAKAYNLIGASVDYYAFPTVSISPVTVTASSFSGSLRVYPFRGAVFLGLTLGSRQLSGSKTDTISGFGPTTFAVDSSALVLGPHLGWRWVSPSGFFTGIELGYQFVLSSTNTPTVTPAAADAAVTSAGMRQEVQEFANDIGGSGLPQIALLQLGYLF